MVLGGMPPLRGVVPLMTYQYHHAEVIRVIDGDTVELAIDLGNSIRWKGNFRLFGIDTPERGRPGFHEATAYLASLLASGLARVETHKPDKYGRWLVDLYVWVDHGELYVNRMMVVEGHAVEYSGGAR